MFWGSLADVRASQVAQWWRIQGSLGQEDPLRREVASHSSIFAWEIPRTEESDGLQSGGYKELDMT